MATRDPEVIEYAGEVCSAAPTSTDDDKTRVAVRSQTRKHPRWNMPDEEGRSVNVHESLETALEPWRIARLLVGDRHLKAVPPGSRVRRRARDAEARLCRLSGDLGGDVVGQGGSSVVVGGFPTTTPRRRTPPSPPRRTGRYEPPLRTREVTTTRARRCRSGRVIPSNLR